MRKKCRGKARASPGLINMRAGSMDRLISGWVDGNNRGEAKDQAARNSIPSNRLAADL